MLGRLKILFTAYLPVGVMTLYDMFGRYVWRLYLEVDSDQISGKTKHHERQEHLKDCGIFLDIGPCFLHDRRLGWSRLYVNSVNVVDG